MIFSRGQDMICTVKMHYESEAIEDLDKYVLLFITFTRQYWTVNNDNKYKYYLLCLPSLDVLVFQAESVKCL